ncbi:MAG: phosphatase PAP2 family protein [Roseivivax sp.]|nr:phosphatase PAP2 family protein [Roseivivax sp.]
MTIAQFFGPLTRRVESVSLFLIIAAAGSLWAFIGLAEEMAEGELQGFDRWALMLLRNPADASDPLGPGAVETAMRDITALGGVTVLTLLTVAVVVALYLRRKRASALFLLVAVLGGQVLSHVTKLAFDRPRPDLVPHGVEVLTASFPSGHSMMATTTYLTLAVLVARVEPRKPLKLFYIALAAVVSAAVGISRVYLGVHWPSDVLAGWTLGAAWALACWTVARWLGGTGRIETETAAPGP